MDKGDVLLIPFPFTDLSGQKLRPALVLAETKTDITVAFITTQLYWQDLTDVVLNPDLTNGIKRVSLIRLSKLATLDKSLAIGTLGKLNKTVLIQVDENLRKIFAL